MKRMQVIKLRYDWYFFHKGRSRRKKSRNRGIRKEIV